MDIKIIDPEGLKPEKGNILEFVAECKAEEYQLENIRQEFIEKGLQAYFYNFWECGGTKLRFVLPEEKISNE